MEPTPDKAERFERVAEVALKLIEKHGLERLTIAQVARTAKVSRSWIYKYVGSSQTDLVQFAVDHFGRILASIDRRDNPKDPKAWIESALSGTVDLFNRASSHPWLVILYFRYRGTPTVPGRRIDQIEKQYVRVFAQEVQEALGFGANYAAFLATSIMAVRMGLVHQWVTTPQRDLIQQAKLLELVEVVLMKMVISQ